MKTLFTSILLMTCLILFGQQYPDRHNTSVGNSWISCQESQNPNPDRGTSHWIQYDLGTTYALQQSNFWNLNAYEHTDDGISDMMIDYSEDGVIWKNYGRFSLDQAEAISTYEGEPGPDFNGIIARYLLITSTGNYGGTCHGFSEFRVEVSPVTISNVSDRELDIDLIASPNPFREQTTISLSDLPKQGNLIYQLSDITGQIVRQGPVINDKFIVDGTGLSSGVYNATIVHEQGVKTIQINLIK